MISILEKNQLIFSNNLEPFFLFFLNLLRYELNPYRMEKNSEESSNDFTKKPIIDEGPTFEHKNIFSFFLTLLFIEKR